VGVRNREEIEKQRAHERYIKLQEQGKTEQSKKDLGVCPTFFMCASLLWIIFTVKFLQILTSHKGLLSLHLEFEGSLEA
jgi:hypothetical protein